MRSLWRMEVGSIDPGRLVFVDEIGTHTSLAPLYAYAPVGQRAFFKIPRNRGKNTTLLTSIDQEGMGPSLALQGATDARVFETYVERLLAPALKPGQVVVMDNLGAHRPRRVRDLIEQRGCELIYLPSYSPDLNPIEICQPQCAFKHKLSYHWPRRAARTTGVGREARSRPPTQRRGGSAMSSRGAVPPAHSHQRAASSVEGASPGQSQAASGEPQPPAGVPPRGTRHDAEEGSERP